MKHEQIFSLNELKLSSNKKLPISVAMVVYNEERLIARALKSCADLVDDIVVVHDGACSDRTLEIAKEFKCRIFVEKHIGAPEPHRPFSFSKTKHNWVLQLDADEYLDTNFRKQLASLIEKGVSGYTVNWVEIAGKKRFVSMTKEVLFQKDRIYYIGAPCEYAKPVKENDKLIHASVGLINAPKLSNFQSWKDYVKKYTKIREIQAQTYALPFKKLKTWNYPKKDWDRNTRLKINNPLALGVMGMNIKFILELLRKSIGQKTPSSLPSIMHQMWYNTTLYWRVFQIKSSLLNSKL